MSKLNLSKFISSVTSPLALPFKLTFIKILLTRQFLKLSFIPAKV